MLKIGLTGGIGSGKTTVARIFETLDIPVYYADDAARRLMNTDASLKAAITAHFGKDSYKQGELDRKYLADIVFNNPEKLELLNSLTHPATIRDAVNWIQQQRSQYIIKEAALLFESKADAHLDYVVGVFAPESLRIRRVTERDQVSGEEVKKRISRQLDEVEKMKLCDFVVVNDEEQLLVPQVLALHQQFLEMASKNEFHNH